MEITFERSPQHWGPNEGSNSEPFDHKNDAVTDRPQLQIYFMSPSSTYMLAWMLEEYCVFEPTRWENTLSNI